MFLRCILFFSCFLVLPVMGLHGQSPIPLTANEHVTVTIFFPSNVVRIVPPAVNFKFEYDKDTNIGLLRGRKGNPSNLTVITEKGYIYSFALQYAEQVADFNYILGTEQAIGSVQNQRPNEPAKERFIAAPSPVVPPVDSAESIKIPDAPVAQNGTSGQVNGQMRRPDVIPVVEDTLMVLSDSEQKETNDAAPEKPMPERPVFSKNGEDDLYMIDREEYYRIFCENNYLQKTIFKRSFRQSKKVVLKLNNILVDRNEIYFVLQIENNSKKEYQVNGLSFFKELGVGELQKIMTPLYTFNLQNTIDAESINEVVYVFKNFRINNKEKVHVVLDELEDNRMVKLPLDYNHINFPSN